MSKKKKQPAQPMLDENGRKPLKLDYPQTFKVGFAFAIIMLFWTAYDFVVPLLLENAYGLPNWLRGLIMGLDNLLSLFMLPLFGKLSDNAHGKLAKKWGRRTPFIVIGTVAAVVLMVFVPVATLGQQRSADAVRQEISANLNDEAWMREHLTEWYDNAESGKGNSFEVDLEYLNRNNITKEQFVNIRFDEKMTSKKAVLNMLGAVSYYYDGLQLDQIVVDGEKHLGFVLDGSNDQLLQDLQERGITVEKISCVKTDSGYTTAQEGATHSVILKFAGEGQQSFADFDDVLANNANYKKYVATPINNFTSDQIHERVTATAAGKKSIAVYMVILLLVLIAMATFRSPAVALMPDVTPKPLRSQGNAIINLCGGVGGAIAFLIYTIVLFGNRLENYVIIFASVGAGMLLLLGGFLALVRERKMVERCQEICKEYGIDDFDTEEKEVLTEGEATYSLDSKPGGDVEHVLDDAVDPATVQQDTTLTEQETITEEQALAAKEVVQNSKRHMRSPKEWWQAKSKLERSKLISFWLILASIFMWFMGYNAISSSLSVYTTKALNLDAGIASIISGVSMGVSAIAFIPVGYMAAKIGRRKSIIIGFAMAVVSFLLICLFVKPEDNQLITAVLFALFYLIAGFGLIIANVNTFPMVTELSTAETVGQYTGYYYVATMSAQAITPMIGGAVMDLGEDKFVFLYSAICIVVAIVLMLFVKHGDSKPIGKGRKLTKEEKKQIRLDALDAD